jgi:hypothetical protein
MFVLRVKQKIHFHDDNLKLLLTWLGLASYDGASSDADD